MRKVYLDNNATTRMREEVLDAMLPYYKDIYGNASSVHGFGRAARMAVDDARVEVAKLLGAASADALDPCGREGSSWCRHRRGVPEAITER